MTRAAGLPPFVCAFRVCRVPDSIPKDEEAEPVIGVVTVWVVCTVLFPPTCIVYSGIQHVGTVLCSSEDTLEAIPNTYVAVCAMFCLWLVMYGLFMQND